jgi:hypothetical protein
LLLDKVCHTASIIYKNCSQKREYLSLLSGNQVFWGGKTITDSILFAFDSHVDHSDFGVYRLDLSKSKCYCTWISTFL